VSVGLAVLMVSFSASASSVDVFGFGARSVGRGQGGVAVADGGMTVFRNPALLQKLSWAEATVGYSMNRTSFPKAPPVHWDTNRDGRIDSQDVGLEVPAESPRSDGLVISIARHVGSKVGVALNAFLPTERFLRLRTTEPSLPSWVMYGNRTQRFELGLGLGAELYKGLSFGVGTAVVAKARYQIGATMDLTVSGASEGDEGLGDLVEDAQVDVHEMTLDLIPRFVPSVGFVWDAGVMVPALDGLSIGLVWRGSSGFPVTADIDLQVNGELGEMGSLEPMGVALVMPIELSIYDHYVPERYTVGLAYQHDNTPRVYVDLHHTRWSEMRVNVAHLVSSDVRTQLVQLDPGLIQDGNSYNAKFVDTVSLNTGVELFLPGIDTRSEAGTIHPVIRAGFGYIPSPLSAQGIGTSFLDSDRMLFTAGVGVVHQDPFKLVPGPVGLDVFYSRHQLAKGELKPRAGEGTIAGTPLGGKAIPIGGSLSSLGLQFSVSF